MLRVGIVGVTGYTGEELLKRLIGHPEVKITSLSAKIDKVENISKIFPGLYGKVDMECKNLDVDEVTKKCDLVFLALPHGISMGVAPQFLKADKKVIDLSADYRFKDVSIYERWYNVRHKSSSYISNAIYGLPELYRSRIKTAELVANPGCYPTSVILGTAPALKDGFSGGRQIIVDSKSGVTGAGRSPSLELHFSEINENLRAYKINQHRHLPEMEQELSKLAEKKTKVVFVPHLIPMNRGILSTIYLELKKSISQDELLDLYTKFYKDEPFVRILDKDVFPQTKSVSETNYCALGIKVDEKSKIAIIISAIDNLIKGASGQAIQNMNIMCGFDETIGLE